MPYDSFGNYSLHQLLDVLRGGTNDLFVDFSVFEDDGRYYHIEDNHTGIVSTKDVRISEDLENCLSRIRGREQGKFRDFVDKMSNGCKCAVILANRPDATLGINFAIELSKLYPKSTITVVNVRSDFSLGDKIVFRELYSKRRVRVLEVMFDDRSDVKWTGNEEKWAEFLSKFYHTR